jgi:acyl-coenzyme A synthetase/AMP-(fatty) acid ligase
MPGRGDRLVLLNSLIHTMGLVGGVLHALNSLATLVIPASFRPSEILRAAAGTEANVIFGVPVHFDLLTREKNVPRLAELRLAASAGEVLPRDVYDRFLARYQIPVCQIYGMTELGVIASDLKGRYPPPIVGEPAPGIEVKLAGGELYVRVERSPYLNADTVGRVADGWLRTFDRFEYRPRPGVLAYCGRADSVFTIGGMKIDLTEVESVLLEHPGVRDVVVVGAAAIEAYVGSSEALSAGELTAWCRGRLSDLKIPKHFFIDTELPRNPNGKLLRNRELLHTSHLRRSPGVGMRQSTRSFVVAQIKRLNIDIGGDTGDETPLCEGGLDMTSIAVLQLITEVERASKILLSVDIADIGKLTVGGLVDLIAEQKSRTGDAG